MRRWLLDPHVALALGAAGVVGAEIGYREATSVAWLLLALAAAGGALVVAWRGQDRLRLAPLLALAIGFQLAYLGSTTQWRSRATSTRLSSSAGRERDPRRLLPALRVPRRRRPPVRAGGVASGGETRWTNALLMVPFQLVCVWAVWSLRTRFAPWLAALVALWPANAFYWEFKYDLAPAALLALGVLLAVRALGLERRRARARGAGEVDARPRRVVLVAHLLARRRFDAERTSRPSPRRSSSCTSPCWSGTRRRGRRVHAPRRPSDHRRVALVPAAPRCRSRRSPWPHLVRRRRPRLGECRRRWPAARRARRARRARVAVARRAAALAALAPATFLLLNRIFSPQFAVVVLVAWALASALVARNRAEQLAAGVPPAVATAANAFVYPFALPFYETTWQPRSATLFAVGLALTGVARPQARTDDTHTRSLVHSILHFGSTETYIRELVRRADPAKVRWTLVIPDDGVLQPLREPRSRHRVAGRSYANALRATCAVRRRSARRGPISCTSPTSTRLRCSPRALRAPGDRHAPHARAASAVQRTRPVARRLAWSTRPFVVFTSDLDRQTGLAREPITQERTAVILLGIDLERFAARDGDGRLRRELAIQPEVRIVGTVGLLKAEAPRPPRGSGGRGRRRVLIAGEGPERPALGAQIARLGLGDRVFLLGHRDDVPEVLADMDVFALSSDYEGMCLAVAEALAVGTPVVATWVGGVPQTVAHERPGCSSRPATSRSSSRRSGGRSATRPKRAGSPQRGKARAPAVPLDAMVAATLALYERRGVKVAVVGCGAAAEFFHLPALASVLTRNDVWLVDRDVERACSLAPLGRREHVFADHREPAVDAAIVAAPNDAPRLSRSTS